MSLKKRSLLYVTAVNCDLLSASYKLQELLTLSSTYTPYDFPGSAEWLPLRDAKDSFNLYVKVFFISGKQSHRKSTLSLSYASSIF